MYGHVKFYIVVRVSDDRERVVQVAEVGCAYEDRAKVAAAFLKRNSNLPVIRAQFTAQEDVPLNFR